MHSPRVRLLLPAGLGAVEDKQKKKIKDILLALIIFLWDKS